ncbi:hypothetical protein DVH05_003240 [Phytophthora capsici]|nr:hypothetical protein DVH05_003240 [Phytophthora capsici]
MRVNGVRVHAQQSRPRITFGAVLAFVAVFGRVVVAPMLLLTVFGVTKYLTSGQMFIEAPDSYFAFSAEDAVMVGGCTNCQVGCRTAVFQMSLFEYKALMSKPLFENLYTMSLTNVSLSASAIGLADTMEKDGTMCMSGFDEWGSPVTTFKGAPKMIVDVVHTLNLSVMPQVLLEVETAIHTVVNCRTDWVLEAHLRLFKFPTTKASADFSAVSVADFTVFPERTECRPNVSNSDIVGSKLALPTAGYDLLAVVPDILTLFPYSFNSSLPLVSRTIRATDESDVKVLQPLFHGYYGGCRVREVNTTGVYIEEDCVVNQHWVNYGLMVQAPDDLPVCTTGDVCVHNYYNSLWEFVTTVDHSAKDRLTMAINVFRSRYADRVKLSVLPGIVVAQMLIMGVISLYQVMSHKRSVLLTQIWAYRCQNGRMQVLYLVQITYHLITSSDLYYLGLATGTLTTEALTNLAFCFFVFSYSSINLLKARSGEQQLARHFRLTWETMQVFISIFTVRKLYSVRQTSLVFILSLNGELLRKTTARGAAMCNLSDSCIVFKHNLVLLAIISSLALGSIAAFVSYVTHKYVHWCVESATPRKDFRAAFRRVGRSIKPEVGPSISCIFRDGPPLLTSFERHCLGAPFSRLFTDCGDFAYTTYEGRRCSSVEAILLTGFMFYGEHVYQAQDIVLLLLERLLPRKFTRTFNILFVRWQVNKRAGNVSYPQACTWFRASDDAFRLMEARPIA